MGSMPDSEADYRKEFEELGREGVRSELLFRRFPREKEAEARLWLERADAAAWQKGRGDSPRRSLGTSPAPLVASDIAHKRSGPIHLYASFINVGGRCLLSEIISTVKLSKVKLASNSPGLRHGPSRTVVDWALQI